MSIRILHLPLGPLQTNCYVLACTTTNKAAVIDPSWEGHTIASQAQKNGWTITHILLTHAHFDHVGGVGELRSETNASIYAHPDTLPMLERAVTSAAMWGFTIDPPPAPDVLLHEGDIIKVGDVEISVLFTPGHAPGHVCFYLPEHKVLFDGDVLFQGSIGRTDLPGGDFDLLMGNINRQLMVLPDETAVLSGHGPITTIGDERRNNPFLQ